MAKFAPDPASMWDRHLSSVQLFVIPNSLAYSCKPDISRQCAIINWIADDVSKLSRKIAVLEACGIASNSDDVGRDRNLPLNED